MAKKLKFYDLKKKKTFMTDKYKVVGKKTKVGMRKMAVAKAPSGAEARVFVSGDFKR